MSHRAFFSSSSNSEIMNRRRFLQNAAVHVNKTILRKASLPVFDEQITGCNSSSAKNKGFFVELLRRRKERKGKASLLRDAVNWRWSRRSLRRILFEQLHCFLHRALKLRIVSLDHFGGSVLDFDIRRHTFILDRPLPGKIIERQDGRGDAAAIDCWRHAERADQASPRPGADHWPELPEMEHIRQCIAA